MKFTRRLQSICLFLAAGLALATTACSSKVVGEGAVIKKVNTYHLEDFSKPVRTEDPSVAFDRSRRMRGAISPVEMEAREGDYYAVMWSVEDRSQPVTVRFEYTQKSSGLKVKAVEKEIVDIGRNNVTEFNFIGDDYLLNGRVTSWRASLVRGKTVLVTYDSYLWK